MTKTETAQEIVIRRAKGSEMYRVINLITEAFSKEISISGLNIRRLESMARLYRLLSYFFPITDFLGIDIETVLVAVSNGNVVGEIHAVPHGRRIWSLDSAAVDSQFRGRGIYRKLLKEAVEYISKKQGRKILTSLWTTNMAPVKVTNELKFNILEEKKLLYLESINTSISQNKGNVKIRNAERNDVSSIREICEKLCHAQAETCNTVAADFSESMMQSFRNRITQLHSQKWIMEFNGEIIGYVKIAYTSSEEAANIEHFYVLPSEAFSEHVDFLLREVLTFLRNQSIGKVTASINAEWNEVIKRFESLEFKSVASVYEMEKTFP